ncbi:hypothetical protein LTR51_008628 [Lithohypha guttulata]|nr:hypothetical protein LTR51_008628 [Lithohypha guttulata]
MLQIQHDGGSGERARKRSRLAEPERGSTLAQESLLLEHQYPSNRSYGNTPIYGNASLLQGDNYGSLVNNHYHFQESQEDKCSALLQSSTTEPMAMYDADILASLAFPQMFDRRNNVGQPHANTCKWILGLEEYKCWKTQPCGLLWIKGKPGAGKSTLMSFLYHRLREQRRTEHGVHLDFFFSTRGTDMQRTPLGMLRSLLNQLFHQDASIRPPVRELYTEKCTAFGRGERSWECSFPYPR